MATDPLSIRRLRAWLRLLRLVRGVENQLRESLRVRFDTTLPRFDVAAALYRQKTPIKMSELSSMLLVSNGNATTVVDRLEQEGRVQRVASESDRRVILVELTPEGRAWFSEVSQAHEAEVNRLLSELDGDDLYQLRELIRRAERAINDKDG